MLNSRRFAENDGDQIEANERRLHSGAARPGACGTTLRNHLQAVHFAFGRTVRFVGARFHFDKNRPASLLGDDVNFGQARSCPVAREDAKSVLLQVAMSQVFAPASQRMSVESAAAQGGMAQRIKF